MRRTELLEPHRLGPGAMLYLGTRPDDLHLRSDGGAHLILLGGVPFEEEIVMWWTFVARDNDEIIAARAAWTDGPTFGDVDGFDGYRLPAPPLPGGRLRPGGGSVR